MSFWSQIPSALVYPLEHAAWKRFSLAMLFVSLPSLVFLAPLEQLLSRGSSPTYILVLVGIAALGSVAASLLVNAYLLETIHDSAEGWDDLPKIPGPIKWFIAFCKTLFVSIVAMAPAVYFAIQQNLEVALIAAAVGIFYFPMGLAASAVYGFAGLNPFRGLYAIAVTNIQYLVAWIVWMLPSIAGIAFLVFGAGFDLTEIERMDREIRQYRWGTPVFTLVSYYFSFVGARIIGLAFRANETSLNY